MKSKEEYWDRVFKGYERSGLSQEEFYSEQKRSFTKVLRQAKRYCLNPFFGRSMPSFRRIKNFQPTY